MQHYEATAKRVRRFKSDWGDLVLDNVAGSGTTGVACQNLNRNFILMEQEPEYVEIINQRLKLNKDKLEAEYAEIARARVEHAKTED